MSDMGNELHRRWRRMALMSTLADLVWIPAAFSVLSRATAATISFVGVVGTADIWYLERRVKRTGSLTLSESSGADTSRLSVRQILALTFGVYGAGALLGAATGCALDDDHRARGAFIGAALGVVAAGALALGTIRLWQRRLRRS